MSDWQPDICIYHGDCDDGFAAAWAVWKRWPTIEFHPGFYGQPLPDVAGKDVLFVDFSAKRPVIDALAQVANSIVIIDHHKTAQEDLEPFTMTMCGSAILCADDVGHVLSDFCDFGCPPIVAWFDMNQSGATLAWQFVHGTNRQDDPCPTMLTFIEDRDLWRFAFGDSTRQFSAALRSYPMDFEIWDDIARVPDRLIEEGKIVLRAHRANLRKILSESYMIGLDGHTIPVVNAPYHYSSDAAHELLALHPDAPFAASWFRRADGKVQWSLRSEDHRLDVSEIAKAHGGGGHRNAAGFERG